MAEEARSAGAGSVSDVDRRLLELLRAGHSTVTAGERLGLNLAGTALRLQALRRRLGVAGTAAAIGVVCGGLPSHDDARETPDKPCTSPSDNPYGDSSSSPSSNDDDNPRDGA